MSFSVLPSDLVTEILTRLPGKQVGRCKCVCNRWVKIIRSRPFKETYRRRQRGLLLYWSEDIRHCPLRRIRRFHFFHCPLRRPEEPPEEFIPLRQLELEPETLHSGVTQLINGLLCVCKSEISGDILGFSITLHNVCTGEKMRVPDPLPCAHSCYPLPCANTCSTYHLGYDPTSRVYKLLRLILYKDNSLVRGAHIITLTPPSSGSPSTWRELDFTGAGIYHLHLLPLELYEVRTSPNDGMLCWMKRGTRQAFDRLLCFDLIMERFRLLDCPVKNMVLGGMTHWPGENMILGGVTRVKDRLALWTLSMGDDYKVDHISCYFQEDDRGKNWSKHLTEICSFATPSENQLSFSLNGEMLVRNPDQSWRVYCYSCQDADKKDAFFVGKLPDGAPNLHPYCLSHFWQRKSLYVPGTLSGFMEVNNLYLPLDDVLSGADTGAATSIV